MLDRQRIQNLDKLGHAAVGAACALAGTLLGFPRLGLLACYGYALGKEVWDYFRKDRVPDGLDALATMTGGLAVHALR